MANFPSPPNNTRIGFHYFPDTDHYREVDLQFWLPELKTLGASWVVLLAPSRRTIPDYFLTGLIDSGIEPMLHFPISLANPPSARDMGLLFSAYARWGAHYAILFDRPNSRAAWPATAWAQSDLVERFLDRFVPLSAEAARAGLYPVFPPLQPGGGYWDTAFLRAALQGLERRGQGQVLERLVLSALAPAGERPLNWGCGGPERWPEARPYANPAGGEDHRSFRIFDWYTAIDQAVNGQAHPVTILGVNGQLAHEGLPRAEEKATSQDGNAGIRRSLAIAQAISGAHLPASKHASPAHYGELGISKEEPLEPVPSQVLSSSYWLLAASPDSPHAAQAWFEPDGTPRPVAQAMRRWAATSLGTSQWAGGSPSRFSSSPKNGNEYRLHPQHPIAHYLLLPAYDWGVTDWHLNAVRPFVKKHRPVVGFSLEEAACAARVTVIGGSHFFSEADLDELRAAGCIVERIDGDGTSIATLLAES